MDEIAETAGVSKRTIYNHFLSKENLFQEIVADFLARRDGRKPIEYAPAVSVLEQLRAFARAEIFLVADPVNRGLSKLLTSIFLMDSELGKTIRSRHSPHQDLIRWLEAAKNDGKLIFPSAQSAARIFYGLVEGCITWGALLSDGANLPQADAVIDEIIEIFLSRYGALQDDR